MGSPPPLGICLPVKYSRVRDGDTPEFVLRTGQRIAVRMIDVFAPELSEAGGEEASARLAAILSEAVDLRIFIPLASAGRDGLLDVIDVLRAVTFDRVPAHVYADGDLVR